MTPEGEDVSVPQCYFTRAF